MLYYILFFVIALTLVYVGITYARIKAMPEGDTTMARLAAIVRGGSETFLKIEFKTIAIVVLVLAVTFSMFIEATSGITFLIGAIMSSLACIIGMKSATYANVRTTNKALETLSTGETVKVALKGGSILWLFVLGCLILAVSYGFTKSKE